jgi:hypothetical protein
LRYGAASEIYFVASPNKAHQMRKRRIGSLMPMALRSFVVTIQTAFMVVTIQTAIMATIKNKVRGRDPNSLLVHPRPSSAANPRMVLAPN